MSPTVDFFESYPGASYIRGALPGNCLPNRLLKEFPTAVHLKKHSESVLFHTAKQARHLATFYERIGYEIFGITIEVATQDRLPGKLLTSSFSVVKTDLHTKRVEATTHAYPNVSQNIVPLAEKVERSIVMKPNTVKEIHKIVKEGSWAGLRLNKRPLTKEMAQLIKAAPDSSKLSIRLDQSTIKVAKVQIRIRLLLRREGPNPCIVTAERATLCSLSLRRETLSTNIAYLKETQTQCRSLVQIRALQIPTKIALLYPIIRRPLSPNTSERRSDPEIEEITE